MPLCTPGNKVGRCFSAFGIAVGNEPRPAGCGTGASAKPLFDALEAGAPEVIYCSPQVQMAPLYRDGLPPTYYTNAFLVGRDPAYLIDPGPTKADEQARLFTLLDARLNAGARSAGVLLTHHHPDHIGATNAVVHRYGHRSSPIPGRPALTGKVKVDLEISDGATLDLGVAPHGGACAWKRSTLLAMRPAISAFMKRRTASFLSVIWRLPFRRWLLRRRRATSRNTCNRYSVCGRCPPSCCCRLTVR